MQSCVLALLLGPFLHMHYKVSTVYFPQHQNSKSRSTYAVPSCYRAWTDSGIQPLARGLDQPRGIRQMIALSTFLVAAGTTWACDRQVRCILVSASMLAFEMFPLAQHILYTEEATHALPFICPTRIPIKIQQLVWC